MSRHEWVGDAFNYTSPTAIFGEYVALSTATRDFGRALDLSVFADVDYAEMIPTQWPHNDKHFFADGQFYRPDGKARMLALTAPQIVSWDAFTLNTACNPDQWHTMTRTGKAPRLGAHLAESYLEIHPKDAAKTEIKTGDLVTINSAQDQNILRALGTDRVSTGQLFAPMHWIRQRSSAGIVNLVTTPVGDPVSGQTAV